MPEFFTRKIDLRAAEADGETIPCTLSSEEPADRGEYVEILSHAPGDVDLTRTPLPVLVQHDRSTLNVGVIEQIRIEDRKLKGVARFGPGAQAQEILAGVKAGIFRNLSVGYQLTRKISEAGRTIRFAWQPYECSVVSVPMDPQAGFYRSSQAQTPNSIKENIMADFIEEVEDTKENQGRHAHRRANTAINADRERAKEIRAIGRQFNMVDAADRAIDAGTPLDVFRDQVMDRLGRQGDNGPLRPHENSIGLSDREIERFSFRKLILAQSDPHYASRECGFEMAASRAYAEQIGKPPRGLWIPPDILRSQHQRDLLAGTPSTGGYLVPTFTEAAAFIDLLRPASQILALGARQLNGLTGNVSIPRKSGSSTVQWVPESGAPIESQMTIGQISLTPKTVAGFSDFSRKMLLQSSLDVENLIREDFAQAIAVELDRVMINGSGTGAEPMGLLKTTGIGSVAIGANGGLVTYDHLLSLEEAVVAANANQANLAYLTNPKIRKGLKSRTKTTADTASNFIWESGTEPGFGIANGIRAAATVNVPSNLTKGTSAGICSAVILGDFSQILLGMWGGLDLMLDPYTGATSGTRRVIALLDVDVGIRQPGCFAAILDATG